MLLNKEIKPKPQENVKWPESEFRFLVKSFALQGCSPIPRKHLSLI